MLDVETQLSDYWAGLVAEYPVPTATEVMQPGGSVHATEAAGAEICERCGGDLTVFDLRQSAKSAPPGRERRRAGVLLAVAAVVLLVVGIVVVDGKSDNISTEEASSSAVADQVPSYQWSRVVDDVVFSDAYVASVTAGGPGLVAVGQVNTGGPDGGSDAAVWTSVDGMAWSRVPHDEAMFGEGQMNSVIVGGPGFVAVGSAVWTSVDGLAWSRVLYNDAVFDGADDPFVNSLVAGGPGLVAVGGANQFSGPHVAVWTSVDGLSWSRVPDDKAVFGGAHVKGMRSVIAGGPGLVAFGRVPSSDGGSAVAVWVAAAED